VPAAELLAHAEKLAGKKPRQSDVLLALAAADGVINAVTLMQESQAPDSALDSDAAVFTATRRLKDSGQYRR